MMNKFYVLYAAAVPALACSAAPVVLTDERYAGSRSIADIGGSRISAVAGHEAEGIRSFRKVYAETELKGLSRGVQKIALPCSGKRITFHHHTI